MTGHRIRASDVARDDNALATRRAQSHVGGAGFVARLPPRRARSQASRRFLAGSSLGARAVAARRGFRQPVLIIAFVRQDRIIAVPPYQVEVDRLDLNLPGQLPVFRLAIALSDQVVAPRPAIALGHVQGPVFFLTWIAEAVQRDVGADGHGLRNRELDWDPIEEDFEREVVEVRHLKLHDRRRRAVVLRLVFHHGAPAGLGAGRGATTAGRGPGRGATGAAGAGASSASSAGIPAAVST